MLARAPTQRNLRPNPAFSGKKENHMEVVYFVGAFVLLSALIYGTMRSHYRNRLRDKVTDQIVRDRYEHNRT
jgi:hypothetical protein